MFLNRAQEKALQGENGKWQQWAMEVLVRIGDSSGAQKLVPVSSVHVPDWHDRLTSGEWSSLAAVDKARDVPITANPGGLGDDHAVSDKGLMAFLRANPSFSFSCAPYLAGNHPARGSVAAWGGRAAVAFANSVLGARSENEDFHSAIASAITGLTAERGLLLEENRQPTVAIEVSGYEGRDTGLLGHLLSAIVKDQVPEFTGIRPDFDEARRFALALNADGRVPLFRLRRTEPSHGLEHIGIEAKDWRRSIEHREDPDLLLFGCPHLSEQDINWWGRSIAGRPPGTAEAWFFTSRLCLDKCPLTGARLAARGRVLADICPLSMIGEMTGRSVGCDSPALASCLTSHGIDCEALPRAELSRLLAR